jgi:hypothetical protein
MIIYIYRYMPHEKLYPSTPVRIARLKKALFSLSNEPEPESCDQVVLGITVTS